MRNYDAATQNALATGIVARRGAILFDFPSGMYGFWDGTEPLIWNSITFNAGAQLLQIESGEQTLAMASNPVTVKLYANPDLGLTEDMLRTIEAENYHQRPVTIYKVTINADTRALISVIPTWRGYVDQIVHEEGKNYAIVGKLESRSIDYSRRGTAMSANAPQQQISPGDLGLEFAGVVGAIQVPFGRETPSGQSVEYVRRPVL